MKCPHCNKEIESHRTIKLFEGFILSNLIPVSFVVGMFIIWIVPLDMEHGYAMEYDALIMLGFMLLYLAYLIAYEHGKVKGKFVLIKKEA